MGPPKRDNAPSGVRSALDTAESRCRDLGPPYRVVNGKAARWFGYAIVAMGSAIGLGLKPFHAQ
jgi:hypothetical protein